MIQQLAQIVFGFSIAVLAFDLIAEHRILLTAISGASMLIVIALFWIQRRRSKWAAFERTLENYVLRHENDVSQSGAHLF